MSDPTVVAPKAWYLSRTLWANLIAGAATVATVFGVDLGLDIETQGTVVAGVMAVLNIVLRFMTRAPIA